MCKQFNHSVGLALCLKMGYVERTYWRIVAAKGKLPHKKKGGRKPKWEKEQIDIIEDVIDEDPLSTLQEALDNPAVVEFPRISVATLSRYLNVRLITYKRASREQGGQFSTVRWILAQNGE